MAHVVPGARPIEVYTNFLEITSLPTAEFHQYARDNSGVLTKGRNYQIVARLQEDNAALFGPRPLYDGGSLLYSKRYIEGQTVCAVVPRRGVQRIAFAYSSWTDSVLRTLLERWGPNERPNPAVMPLNLLQLMVRQAPNLRHGFLPHARRFAVQSGSWDLGKGLSIWRAYFQSVRPALGRMIINVDRSSVPVYTPGPLIELMKDFLGFINNRQLENLSHDQFARLRRHLKGVLIKVRVSANMPAKPIKDLVLQAGLQEFDKDGERMTVQQHFEGRYSNLRIVHPRVVGVLIGRSAIIPAECCIVEPGQVYKRRLDPAVQNKFIKHATQRPEERLYDIQKAIAEGTFNYGDSDYILDAGMTVGSNVLTVTGQIIPPPAVVYRNNAKEASGIDTYVFRRAPAGSWNLLQKEFFVPCSPILTWGVACFGRVDRRRVESFITKLVDNFRKLGMTSRSPRLGPTADERVVLQELVRMLAISVHLGPPLRIHRTHRPQLMLVILPEFAADIKREVKYWGDIKRSVPTQCVRGGKWEKFNDQYCNNLALKINERLGGVNSIIESPISPILAQSMVVGKFAIEDDIPRKPLIVASGADVGHPGSGVFHRPSMTGLVASVDPNIVHFTSSARVQQPRVEMIQDLEEMMFDALSDYSEYRGNQAPPANVIFFRDGVSEGEFRHAEEEIRKIKSAFVRRGWVDQRTQPKLLFVIVGKRHHARFFPKSCVVGEGDARSHNCPAGLVVDNQITNPNYTEFYLLSHSGLLGTSRPGHYTVLENGPKFSMEEIYQISYHLCHIYASATRSVSIPAPKICQRLEYHCKDGGSLSDTASSLSGGEPAFDLEEWKRKFEQSGLRKRKYFL
ncbi:Piwi-domain-containing protein [Polyporus arcularius HHB13444]|uniref:Piwi-domain-containing protein n=1 Tax=Polyporus arcularius HHB13444 TaxID=1314778 RepID=A0A5C3PW38_9APHY|nr:Piwi-domain-containing protein [Polyporus arcularius HHB13444]